MTSSLEQHLLADFLEGSQRLKREIGYNPTYFIRMVTDLGAAEAARHLIRSKPPSDGFTTLWMARKLDMSVEATTLLPWYADLFDDDDRQRARRRLLEYEFDVDGFVAAASARPPMWASQD